MAWWERDRGILEQEIQELQAAGLEPELSQAELAKNQVAINISLKVFGEPHAARILYPDLYPYFRPILITPNLDYNLRHYNPFSGENCLLQRGTRYWLPSMTAAQLITEMLPEWERAAKLRYEDSRLETEDNQAEPKSAYIGRHPNQIIMMDKSWEIAEKYHSGQLKISISGTKKQFSPQDNIVGWVLEISSNDNKPIVQAENEIHTWVTSCVSHKVKICNWTKLPEPPQSIKILDWLKDAHTDVHRRIINDINRNKNFGIYGLCFPEENPSGGYIDGWLFFAWNRELTRKRKTGQPKHQTTTWLITTDPAGEKDFFERIPELSLLQDKKVAVVGLGCIGAPSVLALARSGVGELRLLDSDFVSPGNVCRWPLGLSVAGQGKVQALSSFIKENYPFTRIGTDHYPSGENDNFSLNIGQVRFNDTLDQMECIEKLLADVDLVFDASAEDGLNHLLSDLAKEKNIPYIMMGSRPGGWGGHVVRIQPDSSSGCYLCYLHSCETSPEDGGIPHPPFDAEGDDLQPVGCGDITFKAASFDVEELSLTGVRLVVSTLCASTTEGYPNNSKDVGILSLRKDGESTFPFWQSFPLPINPKCPTCNSEESLDK